VRSSRGLVICFNANGANSKDDSRKLDFEGTEFSRLGKEMV
jgi:hypothetical protein